MASVLYALYWKQGARVTVLPSTWSGQNTTAATALGRCLSNRVALKWYSRPPVYGTAEIASFRDPHGFKYRFRICSFAQHTGPGLLKPVETMACIKFMVSSGVALCSLIHFYQNTQRYLRRNGDVDIHLLWEYQILLLHGYHALLFVSCRILLSYTLISLLALPFHPICVEKAVTCSEARAWDPFPH
jgi:hypothetical protein